MFTQIRKVITLIVTVTYMMMLCSKFIALIAITSGVLFAFIKSHSGEGEREREERKRGRDLHHYRKQIVKQDIKF